jgi:hypothetical protein
MLAVRPEGHQGELLPRRIRRPGVQAQRDPDWGVGRARDSRRQTSDAYSSAQVPSGSPSPGKYCVATATGRAPGAVNNRSLNVPTRVPLMVTVNMWLSAVCCLAAACAASSSRTADGRSAAGLGCRPRGGRFPGPGDMMPVSVCTGCRLALPGRVVRSALGRRGTVLARIGATVAVPAGRRSGSCARRRWRL